jgi:L-ascorbate metabolism protein UlaG (beta-lactamase superfamily)
VQLTFIGLNSWLLEISNIKILLDPWLVADLTLYGLPWLFRAKHQQQPRYTPDTLPAIDLILISQGLDDHCHQPTLKQLPPNIPVVASPSAAKIARQLGFKTVTALSSWETYTCDERVEITATPGAKIQGQLENGFVLKSLIEPDASIYYEPHLATETAMIDRVRGLGVKVAIAPVIGQIFPLLGKVIMNSQDAFHLVESLQPEYFLPTAIGDIPTTGILPRLIRTDGSIAEFQQLLTESQLPTRFIIPQWGETIELG